MKPILGIDIAKDKFDCCLLWEGQKLFNEFPNTVRGFKKLGRWLESHHIPAAHLQTCMEATGRYGLALAAWLFKAGARVSAENPARIKYFAKSCLARNKTDRADAFIIAEFCRTQRTRAWSPLPVALERLRGLNRLLVARKQQLADERRRAAMLPAFLRAHIRALMRGLERQIARLQEEMEELMAGSPELGRKIDLLCSIPSVGKVTAQTVLAELPPGIQSARQAAAYAGLTPQQNDSGQKQGRSRLSKTGNPHLRFALYMPAVSGRTSNGRMKRCAARLQEKGLSKKQIIGACMHLLMRLCFGVLKSGEPYQENWQPTPKVQPQRG
jgi:transposase